MLVITAIDGRQLEKRSVAFVGLGDHVISPAEPGVAAECAQTPADDCGWIKPRALEHQRHHRCRRRLSVRAGDRDAVAKTHQLGEHFRPRDHGNSPAPRFLDLRVRRIDRRRDHDHVRASDLRRRMPAPDPDAELLEPVGDVRRLRVRTADLVTEVHEQLCDPAHSDPANPHEMNASSTT